MIKLNPEVEAIDTLAKIILTSARTAPKARGDDEIITAIVEDKEALAQKMEEIAGERGKGWKFFARDAGNIRNADAVLLIGLKFEKPVGVNCRACGSKCSKVKNKVKEGDYLGRVCSIRAVDLGIAIGSAASACKNLSVDSRVMYSVGAAARVMGLVDANMVFGLPLSVKGKNIFFDR